MLITIATVLAGLIGAGIFFIGTQAFWAPRAALGFGIPGTRTDDPVLRAWLTVKGGRDMGSGILTFVVLVGGSPHLLGWFMLAAAGMPVCDALIVLRNKGTKAAAYGVHGATAAVMLAISVVLLVA